MADTGPPAYYILQSLVNAAFGINEVTLRLLPALFGVLAVWVTYLLGRRLYGRYLGLGAALVVAVARLTLVYSQEARAYSLAMLAAVLVAWTLLRALERPSWGRLAWHALAIVLAAYTHLFALVAAGGIVIGVLCRPRLVRRLTWRWFVALAAAALAFAPWAVVLVGQVRRVDAIAASGQWVLEKPGNLFAALIGSVSAYTPWGQSNRLLTTTFLALVIIGAVAAVDFARLRLRRAAGEPAGSGADALHAATADSDFTSEPDGRMSGIGGTDRLALLGGWAAAVFVGGLLVSQYVMPIFDVRMAIVAAPVLYLLGCNGLTKLWRPAAIAIAIAFLLYTGVGLRYYYTHPRKEQWREATQYLIANGASRGRVVAFTSFIAKDIDEYARILGQPGGMPAERIGRGVTQSELEAQVEAATAGRDSLFLVIGHAPFVSGTTTKVDLALAAHGFRAEETRSWRGVIVRRYVRSAASTPTP
jgi:uncharacterized membrane protein